MTEMEKMEAMKRAYAEMILNTAKEAAERVMAAELRARRTEQELVSVKEEAANMLLRLKEMIDAKTKEAEVTSMTQKKKFEVLESQLNEAEGIILDLRDELNQGQERLDKLKKRRGALKIHDEENAEEFSLTPEVTCNSYEYLASSLNPGPEFSTIGRNNLLSDWITLDQRRCSPAKQTLYSESDVYSGDNSTGLDQIKEPDRFRNGSTQRTCATETSLVGETFSVAEKLNGSKTCTNLESVNAIEGTSVLEEKNQLGNSESVSIVRRSVRKRKLKYWDDVITACGLQSSHQLKKPHQGSTDLSCLATRKMKRCGKYGEDLADRKPKIESLNDAELSKELIHTEALPENMELIDEQEDESPPEILDTIIEKNSKLRIAQDKYNKGIQDIQASGSELAPLLSSIFNDLYQFIAQNDVFMSKVLKPLFKSSNVVVDDGNKGKGVEKKRTELKRKREEKEEKMRQIAEKKRKLDEETATAQEEEERKKKGKNRNNCC